jgi:hypothetical protein
MNLLASSSMVVLIAGCSGVELDLDSTTAAVVVDNGRNLNGRNLNGRNLNGTSELGNVIEWTSFVDAQLGGSTIKGLRLDGSELVGKVNKQVVRGTALVGATLAATSDTGLDLSLRIVAVFAPIGGNEDPTTWRYFVEYQDTDASWVPICLNDTTPVPSIPIDGFWDLNEGEPGDGGKILTGKKFTFACEQVGALGKCIEAGYRPWLKVDSKSLNTYHQSCVRSAPTTAAMACRTRSMAPRSTSTTANRSRSTPRTGLPKRSGTPTARAASPPTRHRTGRSPMRHASTT